MENSNAKEDEGRSHSMASPTTQETESTQTIQETETTQMNNSDEHEHRTQSSTVEPADLQPSDKRIDAERDRMLESLLRAVEEKKDEIFDTKNKNLSNTTLMLHESNSDPSSRKDVTTIEMQKLTSPKVESSNNGVALSFRKRKRKQERPSRAPMGDGLDQILEARTWAEQPPLRASSEVEDDDEKKKKDTKKWSWGRK